MRDRIQAGRLNSGLPSLHLWKVFNRTHGVGSELMIYKSYIWVIHKYAHLPPLSTTPLALLFLLQLMHRWDTISFCSVTLKEKKKRNSRKKERQKAKKEACYSDSSHASNATVSEATSAHRSSAGHDSWNTEHLDASARRTTHTQEQCVRKQSRSTGSLVNEVSCLLSGQQHYPPPMRKRGRFISPSSAPTFSDSPL